MGFTDAHPPPLVGTGLSNRAFAAGLIGGPGDRGATGDCLAEDS